MKKILPYIVVFIFFGMSVFGQSSSDLHLNGKPIPYNKLIELFPGDTMKLVYSPTPNNSSDSLYISSDITSVLPGATFNKTNNLHQIGYFTWSPSNGDVSLNPYEFTLTVKIPGAPITFINHMQMQVRVNKPGSIELNNGPVNLNEEIELEPGTPMNLRFSSVNPALPNAFTISSNVTSALPGATFTTDNALQQTANINFTPTAAQLNSQPYTFTVTYQDNAPVPNKYVYSVKVKVRNAGMLGTNNRFTELAGFTAFPNPFTDVLSFKINSEVKTGSIGIYNLLGQQLDQILISNADGNQENVTWKNAGAFPKGTYFARLVSNEKNLQVLRFIKQ